MNIFDSREFNKPREECGIFGIYSKEDQGLDAARITNHALFALQHRGQQSCGIAVNDNGTIVYHKDLGLVSEVFDDIIINHLKGQIAVGHVRYSAKNDNLRENVQPLVTKYKKGTLTIAHNGNLVNAAQLRTELEENGALFQGSSDTETIAYLIAKERLSTHSVEDAVKNMMDRIRGAYSLVVMSPTKMIAARDPQGFRPLSIGKLGDAYVIASETVAFDVINAKYIRDVLPGEIVVISKDGLKSIPPKEAGEGKMCIFEHVYFARPDSVIEGTSVHEARKQAGRFLARQHPVEADVVIAVPDSGIAAAIGYALESGIPYDIGLMKNRYVARTFIQPTQKMRENAVRIKLNTIKSVLEGKRVVIIDDSIVRGTTSRRIVNLLKGVGVKEVHMRISSPPFLYPCYFGTDVGTQDDLVAVGKTVEEIKEMIGVDSLGYLSVENVLKIPIGSKIGFCTGCFTGEYPMDVSEICEKNKCQGKSKFIKNWV